MLPMSRSRGAIILCSQNSPWISSESGYLDRYNIGVETEREREMVYKVISTLSVHSPPPPPFSRHSVDTSANPNLQEANNLVRSGHYLRLFPVFSNYRPLANSLVPCLARNERLKCSSGQIKFEAVGESNGWLKRDLIKKVFKTLNLFSKVSKVIKAEGKFTFSNLSGYFSRRFFFFVFKRKSKNSKSKLKLSV